MKLLKKILILTMALVIIAYILMRVLDNSIPGHGPVICPEEEEIRISCKYKEKDLLEGLTAYDAEDGDLTKDIITGDFSNKIKNGTTELEYIVFDSDGFYDSCIRKVTFTDYEAPKITLTNPLVFLEEDFSDFILLYYLKGSDMLDGDLSKHIMIGESDVDYDTPGKYKLGVSLANSFGDSVSLDLPVHILEKKDRGLYIDLLEPLVYVRVGDQIDPKSYIRHVYDQMAEKNLGKRDYTLETDSDVDTTAEGVYEIYYKASANTGDLYGETWLTVVVRK